MTTSSWLQPCLVGIWTFCMFLVNFDSNFLKNLRIQQLRPDDLRRTEHCNDWRASLGLRRTSFVINNLFASDALACIWNPTNTSWLSFYSVILKAQPRQPLPSRWSTRQISPHRNVLDICTAKYILCHFVGWRFPQRLLPFRGASLVTLSSLVVACLPVVHMLPCTTFVTF